MTQPNGPYEWLPAMRDVLGAEVEYPDSDAITRGPWIVLDVSYGIQWEGNGQQPWDHWMPQQEPGWNGITLYRHVTANDESPHYMFQLIRGYVWFFDGAGDDEAGSPSDMATQLITLSGPAIGGIGASALLDGQSLTRASDLLFNASWWLMNQGQPQLQGLANEIGRPGSDFDGSAGAAFSWAMQEMAFGMLSLKENITDPIDWTQRLDESAAAIDSFKEAMQAAWSAYTAYQYYDPNELVWGILRSMETQVDDAGSLTVPTQDAANLREWNFSFPEQGLGGPYNLMENPGWQQLNQDMINLYKPHLDQLNQDSLAATEQLINSFNTTYQALRRPVLPLPHLPPPAGPGEVISPDGEVSLDDLFGDGAEDFFGGGEGGEGGGAELPEDFPGGGAGAEGGGAGLPGEIPGSGGAGAGGGAGLPEEVLNTGGASAGGGAGLPGEIPSSGGAGAGGGAGLTEEVLNTGGASAGGGAGLPGEVPGSGGGVDGGSSLLGEVPGGGGSGVTPPEFTSSTGGGAGPGGGAGSPLDATGGSVGGGLPLVAGAGGLGGLGGLPRPSDSTTAGSGSGPGDGASDDDTAAGIPPEFSDGGFGGGGLGGGEFGGGEFSGGEFSGGEFGGGGLGGGEFSGSELGVPGAGGAGSPESPDFGGAGLGGLVGDGGALVPGTTGGYSAVGSDGGFTLGPLGTPPPGYTPPTGLDVPDYSGTGGQVALAGPGAEHLASAGYDPAAGGLGGSGLGGSGLGGTAPGAAGAGVAASGGVAGGGLGGGMPFMPPMMGGMGGAGGRDKERERSTWLTEDSDVWGTDPADCAPAVVGREDLPEPGYTEQPVRRAAPRRRSGESDDAGRRRTN
ncbi:MAG: hypothetical protein ACRDT4_04150 [Micromonosporaceae bacterium]